MEAPNPYFIEPSTVAVSLYSFNVPAGDVPFVNPTVERFTPVELGPKEWGTELLVAHTDHYTGKVLSMNAGHEGPLQHHQVKDETFFLFSGHVWIDHFENDKLVRTDVFPGEAFHIPPGAVHRVGAVEDSVMFEASTPVFDDRVPFGTD